MTEEGCNIHEEQNRVTKTENVPETNIDRLYSKRVKECTLSDENFGEKNSENMACCRKFCLPKFYPITALVMLSEI